MMKIRLAGWMSQRPIGPMATRLFDNRRKTEPPHPVPSLARGARFQLIQFQRRSQKVALGTTFHCNQGGTDLGRNAFPGPVIAESVSCPLGRGRKIELKVPGTHGAAEEGLETGVLPEFVSPHGIRYWRHSKFADLARYGISQYQTPVSRTRNVHFDLCHCGANCVRMNPQCLARNACHRFWAYVSPWSAIDLTGIDRRGVIVA
jgi:hypothetical protein